MITIAGGILLAVAILVAIPIVLANLTYIFARVGELMGSLAMFVIWVIITAWRAVLLVLRAVWWMIKAFFWPQRKLWVLCGGPETITRIKASLGASINVMGWYITLPFRLAYVIVVWLARTIHYRLSSARSNLR